MRHFKLRCWLFGHEWIPVEYQDPNDPFGQHVVTEALCPRCYRRLGIEWGEDDG